MHLQNAFKNPSEDQFIEPDGAKGVAKKAGKAAAGAAKAKATKKKKDPNEPLK